MKHVYQWLLFLVILVLFATLIIPTVNRLGIGWDEEVDLRIARAYLTRSGFFFGIPLDESQTRLPMFIVALVYRLFEASNLILARLTSILMGGCTLLGIYLYGKERISPRAGLLAAGLLGINPYFLSFSRLAFTESDIYLACTLTWLLVSLAHLQTKPSIGNAVVAGLLLGLSISAKATVLVILPAVWFTLFIVRLIKPNKHSAEVNNSIKNALPSRVVWFLALWSVMVLLLGIVSGMRLNISAYSSFYRLIHYGLVCLVWLILVGLSFRFRNHYADPVALAAFVTGFGLLTFVIFPPDHLTNSGIISRLFLRAENEMSLNASYMAELAALHLLTIFLKSTPMLGFALIAGMVTGIAQWRQPEIRLPLFVAMSYFAGLLILPLGQTFYTIPILPVLSLLVADQFLHLWALRRKIALVIAVLIIGWWGVEMIQSYPDYHLNGYQWVGERSLFGRSSIGYASVVFTPEDGVQQVVEWLNANASPGQVAQLYFTEFHVVRYIAPEPRYKITNGFEDSLVSQPDYVATHINALHSQGFGKDEPEEDINLKIFDEKKLKQEYEQVFVVRRAFGLEVASVWQRK